METINNIELRDENIYPDDDVLKSILNKSFPAYKKLLELFTKNDMNYEWRYYHDGKAWLCKVQKKKKTIVWMSAWKDYMQATLYFPEKSKVVYVSKNGKEKKEFDALEWLAAMCSHIPDKGMQMVHYYGYYSNVSRGKRKQADQDGVIPYIIEDKGSNKEYRKNWARLIQKIYEVDPLVCPKCQGKMKVIAFIEDEEVVKKILKHLGLWDRKTRPPLTKNIVYEPSDTDHLPFYPDPEYPVEMYIPQ